MDVYIRADDFRERRERTECELAGRIAAYTLLAEQRRHTGGDIAEAERELRAAERDREAHEAAPDGTALHYRRDGGAGIMWVIDTGGKQVFFGPRDEWVDRFAAGDSVTRTATSG